MRDPGNEVDRAHCVKEEKSHGCTHRELEGNVGWNPLQSCGGYHWVALSRMRRKRLPRRRRGDRVRKANVQETKGHSLTCFIISYKIKISPAHLSTV